MPRKLKLARGIGKSMAPFINEGDTLFVKHISLRQIKKGDVIVFTHYGGKYVGHRVVAIGGNSVDAKGDNLPVIERTITEDKIIGLVVRIDGKYGTLDLTTSLTRMVSQLFLFYSLATYYVPRLVRRILISSLRGRKHLVRLRTHLGKK